jgi:hypothetical protein
MFMLFIIGVVALALIPSTMVQAQQTQDFCVGSPIIDYGDTVTGEITNDSAAAVYCFDGNAGDDVTVSVEATSGNLDTVVILGDTTLEEFYASNDDISDSSSDSELSFELPMTGQYLILVSRYEMVDGESTGQFRMTLSVAGGDSDGGRGGLGGLGGGTPVVEEDPVVINVTCDTGEEIRGGVQFSFININPGFSYTVTAVGIDGFDPVIAVETQPGIGTCNDDAPAAARSVMPIPGEGRVIGDSLTAQVRFVSPRTGFPLNITVGSYGDEGGRFAMVIEGLAISPFTELDGFAIRVPTSVAQEELAVYMVARTTSLDPFLQVGRGPGLSEAYIDNEFDADLVDFENVFLLSDCDDAGLDIGGSDCTDTEPFSSSSEIDIANGSTYITGGVDAGIVGLPESSEPLLYIFGSASGRSGGDYAILIIGHVPEAP